MGINIRLSITKFALVFFFIPTAFAAELLHLDFNDSNHLDKQSNLLPTGELNGAAKASPNYPGSIEFGPAGGFVRIPNFHSPKGPYTVEARFLIHNYGPESGRFISDILSTATWGNGPSQGLELKVGGGYLYPPLPRDAYKTNAEWVNAQGGYSYINRGMLSDCFAAFFMARKDNPLDWKGVYTNRCIEKNAWTHLVGVWDGVNMRIYLNGTDATDIWRVQGLGAEPLLDSVVAAYVGSGYNVAENHTNIDGILDYVKVQDGVLSDYEIHKRYQDNFVSQIRDSLCMGVVVPHYPEAGQLCKGKLDLEFKIIKHGACTDSTFKAAFHAGDSVEIEIAKNASFTDLVLRITAVTTLHLEAKDLSGLAGYQGEIYWRVRLIPAKHGALAKSSAGVATEWSLSRPLVMDMSDVSAIRVIKTSLKPVLVQAHQGLFVPGSATSSEPILWSLSGKRQPVRFQRVTGGWRMDANVLTYPQCKSIYLIYSH